MDAHAALRALILGSLILTVSCTSSDSHVSLDPSGSVSPLVGKPAPDIEGRLHDGTEFSLKEKYASDVVLLDFWATWCPPCVMELPVLIKIADEYKSRGVVLYTVNSGEDAETIQQFLKEQNWQFNVVLDEGGKHSSAYQVSGIPQLVVIDRGGVVQEVHVGYSDNLENELRKELDSLIAK